jgi:hypothetical protein
MRLSFDGDAETGFYSYYFVEERIMKAKKGGRGGRHLCSGKELTIELGQVGVQGGQERC